MNTAVMILVDGISYAAWLFMIGIGLTLVFGVLRLLNIAHGAFYSFGCYVAAYTIGLVGASGSEPAIQFLSAAVLAILVGALLGFVVERTVLSRLYHQPEVLVLFATYAVFLILEDATKLIWGGKSLYASSPRDALGQVRIGALDYPLYDVGLVVVACLVAAATWFVLNATRIGHFVTAVVFDRETSAAMGINVKHIMTGTFVVGSALGALAGAITAPKIAITPGIGVEVIVVAFAVVVIGGLGSITGAVAGALIVGLARAATTHLFPQLELFAVYGAMAFVLAIRPYGLFAKPEARKI